MIYTPPIEQSDWSECYNDGAILNACTGTHFSVHLQVLYLAISFGCTRFYCWQIRFHSHIWKKHLGIKIKIVFCSTALTYEVTESFEWLQTDTV